METIISALIAATASIIVCVVTNRKDRDKRESEAQKERESNLKTHQENMELITYKIDELGKKVEKHNQVIERTFKLENRADVFDEKMKVANHRLEDLERKSEAWEKQQNPTQAPQPAQ